jgi:ribosomal protein S18 acetylase RimI-like enzyme
MNVEFRRARKPGEIRSLVLFDHRTFREHPADWFDRGYWEKLDSWWMLVDGRKAGCCAFEAHVDFREDSIGENAVRRGSLYIATTGVLPRFRGFGLGNLLKCWQVSFARNHGFDRIVTNTRQSNRPMIMLNKKFGFQVIRTTPNYYESPREAAIVMELRL